jgi:hypothetical protein
MYKKIQSAAVINKDAWALHAVCKKCKKWVCQLMYMFDNVFRLWHSVPTPCSGCKVLLAHSPTPGGRPQCGDPRCGRTFRSATCVEPATLPSIQWLDLDNCLTIHTAMRRNVAGL